MPASSNRSISYKKKYKKEYETLKKALKYKHAGTISRFMDEFSVDKKLAITLFEDMIRFFWLGTFAEKVEKTWWHKNDQIIGIPMYEGLQLFDEIWHVFLMFQRDYEDFCKQYFGKIIYHDPSPVNQPLQKGETSKSKSYMARNEDARNSFIDFVWDTLGPSVANRWFYDYFTNYELKINKKILRK